MAQLNRGPNIYIDEVASDVHTVTGVATSIAAFVDFFARGPMNEATRVLDAGAFNRIYGGLDTRSEASYAIAQYFANGGTQAWVVRTASGGWANASVEIRDAPAGATVFRVEAIHPGLWGDGLRITVDPVSATNFTLSVQLFEMRDGRRVETRSESFRDLSMTPGPRFVESVVNDEFNGSTLVRVRNAVAGAAVPQPVGTMSGPLPAPLALTVLNNPAVDVTIGIEGAGTATMAGPSPTTIAQARARLESAIRAVHPELTAFAQARVSIVGDRLRVQAGPTTDPAAQVTFAPSGLFTTAADLMLTPSVQLQGVVSGDITGAVPIAAGGGQLRATIGAGAPQVITLANPMPTVADVRTELEAALRAAAGVAPEFNNARVALHAQAGVNRLVITPDAAGAQIVFAQEGADTTFADLALDPAAVGNPAADALVTRTGDLAAAPAVAAGDQVMVTIGGLQRTATLGGAATFPNIRTQLENAIRGVPGATPPFTGSLVAYYGAGENRYMVVAGGAPAVVLFGAAPLDATTVVELGLDAGVAAPNVQSYALGGPAAGVAGTAQGPGIAGNDGVPPDGNALRGDPNLHTGLYALDGVDLFNILCIPRTGGSDDPAVAPLPDIEATAVIAEARNYCERRRAFFIVDAPVGIDNIDEMQAWMDMPQHAGLRHRNLAIYFPRVQVPDPLDGFRLRSFGASGTMAGVYSRIDGTRGVWKAPAGLEATLSNVQRLDFRMTDSECGVLNPLGINCLRTFPVSGNLAWGARTLVGADVPDSEWKYISIRRLALFLEETLFRNTTWIIFEPNDEPLWAKIRLNLNAFMMGLFRQGAFQGSTPDKAFFVKCDAETTTQADRNLGIVNIDVGFSPLKPCEFVVIRIQQMRGDLA
jgi:hypothetical protein